MLTAVIGAQWGDEGKGKIVDCLAKDYDWVVRFNGGNNAGHSVVIDDCKYCLSLVPSGVFQKKKLLISQGVVIDPKILLAEIDKYKPNLIIDYRVHIVMDYHKLLDAATEQYKGKSKTGSLKLGIGYCYEDKNNRAGVRMEDLIDKIKLKKRLEKVFELKKRRIEKVFKSKFNLKLADLIDKYAYFGKKLKKYIGDVSKIVTNANPKDRILFEGAHGTFLDCVFGTYPYTVAIHAIAGSVFAYVGIPPKKIKVIGVVKAYTTRVGNGPFPTELFDKTAEFIRDKGGEYGTVSKRPRRCGWLDLDMVCEANRLNGFSEIALTKLDVLSGLKYINIYENGRYKQLKGWSEKISSIKNINDLPKNCIKYIENIENKLSIKIKLISVGPKRNQLIKL